MEFGFFGNCCSAQLAKDGFNSQTTSLTTKLQLIKMLGPKNKNKYNVADIVSLQSQRFKTASFSKQILSLSEFRRSKEDKIDPLTERIKYNNSKDIEEGRLSAPNSEKVRIFYESKAIATNSSSKVGGHQRRKSSLYGGSQNILRKGGERQYYYQNHQNHAQISTPKQTKCRSYRQNSLPTKSPLTLNSSSKQILTAKKNYWKQPTSIEAEPKQQILSGFSPQQINYSLKIGKFLGRGKYCHAYLCQDSFTSSIFTVKYIFKKNLQPSLKQIIQNNLRFLYSLSHSSIISLYSYSEDSQKIITIEQFTPSLLYDQIKQKGTLPLREVKEYLKQIIEAVVILHENNRTHGNINPVQIGFCMGACKMRTSLTNSYSKDQFIKDIHAIGFIGYEMAYGLSKVINKHSPLKDEFSYYDHENLRSNILSHLQIKQNKNSEFSSLDSFLNWTLSQSSNHPISGSAFLIHAFFKGQ